jgi:hypothetical protein
VHRTWRLKLPYSQSLTWLVLTATCSSHDDRHSPTARLAQYCLTVCLAPQLSFQTSPNPSTSCRSHQSGWEQGESRTEKRNYKHVTIFLTTWLVSSGLWLILHRGLWWASTGAKTQPPPPHQLQSRKVGGGPSVFGHQNAQLYYPSFVSIFVKPHTNVAVRLQREGLNQ